MPAVLQLSQMPELLGQLGRAAIWGSANRVRFLNTVFDSIPVASLEDIGDQFEVLVVVGGGTRIDTAKQWRAEQRPGMKLIAIPSLWGSGAEASCIVALNSAGKKQILIGPQFLPDYRCTVGKFAESVSDRQAQAACGDAWSHALEGFLSPLADEPLREELAHLMREMVGLPLGRHSDWFELSARACSAQARSSVGLVHGIAHTLEGPLLVSQPDLGWGHARLCSLYLYPVARFNQHTSARFDTLFGRHRLDPEKLLGIFSKLYSDSDYETAWPVFQKHWKDVLRDPNTRTNSALVRKQHLDYFKEKSFQ